MHGFMHWRNRRFARSMLRHYLSEAAAYKIYGNAVKSHHTAANFAASGDHHRAVALYLLSECDNPCDYLLAARSCRGCSDPSKRISDIHACIRTHPGPVTRNMRTRWCVGRAWRPPVRQGCVCLNALSTNTRQPNRLQISNSIYILNVKASKKIACIGIPRFRMRPKLIKLRETDGNNIYPRGLTIYYRWIQSSFTNGTRRVLQSSTGKRSHCRITSVGYAIFIQWNQSRLSASNIKGFFYNEFAQAKPIVHVELVWI